MIFIIYTSRQREWYDIITVKPDYSRWVYEVFLHQHITTGKLLSVLKYFKDLLTEKTRSGIESTRWTSVSDTDKKSSCHFEKNKKINILGVK